MIEIKRFESSMSAEWDKFVGQSVNGTFLHTRAFYNHNPLNEPEDCSMMFFSNGRLTGLFPANRYESAAGAVMHSYSRSTYGGLIVNRSCGVEDSVEMVRLLIEEAKNSGIREIIARNPFRILSESFCDQIDYALWYNGFSVKARELEIAIPLTTEGSLLKNYSDSTYRSIKKSLKKIHVRESDDLQAYWQILDQNLKERHGVLPTHSYSQIRDLIVNVGPEKVKLMAAYLDDKMVAGILCFLINERCIHAQYIASLHEFQEHRPLNAVIHQISLWGLSEKYRYFNLGMANENSGKVFNAGLFRFKEGFGGTGVLRETMSITIG